MGKEANSVDRPSMPWGAIESKAPALISASIARRLTIRRSTFRQKSNKWTKVFSVLTLTISEMALSQVPLTEPNPY